MSRHLRAATAAAQARSRNRRTNRLPHHTTVGVPAARMTQLSNRPQPHSCQPNRVQWSHTSTLVTAATGSGAESSHKAPQVHRDCPPRARQAPRITAHASRTRPMTSYPCNGHMLSTSTVPYRVHGPVLTSRHTMQCRCPLTHRSVPTTCPPRTSHHCARLTRTSYDIV